MIEKARIEKGDITVKEAVEDWLVSYTVDIKDVSRRRYETLLTKYLLPSYGSQPIPVLTESELTKLKGELQKNLSERTVSSVITTTRRVRDKYVQGVTVYGKTPDKSVSKYINETRVQTLSEEDARRLTAVLIRNITPTTFGILLCLHAGLRLSEMCSLEKEDFTDSSLVINRMMQRIRLKEDAFGTKKTKNEIIALAPTDPRRRVIPISDTIREALESEAIPSTGYIITEDGIKILDPRTLENRLKKIANSIGIKEISFNILRNTFAVRCIDRDVDIAVLSKILGHRDISITARRYSEQIKSASERKTSMMDVLGW